MKKLTPVLTVEAIEPSLPFWVDVLGFQKTAEVPAGDRLAFVMLNQGDIEVMLQTRASVRDDQPKLEELLFPSAACLFVEVDDLEAVTAKLEGVEILVPRRETFYGMIEVVVREPGGHIVTLAQPVAK